ncbi:MAG TPA: hypothetical protein VGG07_22310, partial [Solirubrobacteraceae bacterium]
LMASLTTMTAMELATAHQIALRLGHREPEHGKPADEGHGSVGGASPTREHPVLRAAGSVRSGEQPAQIY